MKKYIVLLVTALCTLFAGSALAFTPPDKPDNGWYVVDQAGKLSDSQKSQLNSQIDNINKTTKNEFGVLIVSSLDGDTIEDAAQNTFRSWGIGKKDLNNGVLLMISVGDRKMRLQTGKGAEGDLPDLRAKDILDQQLKPALRKGDFYGGISSTISTTSSFMESHGVKQDAVTTESAPVPVTETAPVTSSQAPDAASAVLGGIAAFFIFMFMVFCGVMFVVVSFFRSRKQQKLEAERLEQLEDDRARRRQKEAPRLEAERLEKRRKEAARLEADRLEQLMQASAVKRNVPVVPAINIPTQPKNTYSTSVPKVSTSVKSAAVAATAVTAASLAAEALAKKKADDAREEQRQKEEEDRAARRKREEKEEEERRRQREEDDRRSSYSSSSSSSFDFGGGGGGGFGGGDSGGGGASSDW